MSVNDKQGFYHLADKSLSLSHAQVKTVCVRFKVVMQKEAHRFLQEIGTIMGDLVENFSFPLSNRLHKVFKTDIDQSECYFHIYFFTD